MKVNKFLNNICAFLKKNNEIVVPSATLLAICFTITLALSLTNLFTANTIKQRDIQAQNAAMSELLPADRYEETVLIDDSGAEHNYYIAYKGADIPGYLFVTSQKGYGGDIRVMTAIDRDGTVIAVTILSAGDETPGLGQNVTKESFFGQFAGINGTAIVLKNGADNSANEINAVTGATISSRATTAAVNEAVALFKYVINPITSGSDPNDEVTAENSVPSGDDGSTDSSTQEVPADE